MFDEDKLFRELDILRKEHKELDDTIVQLQREGSIPSNQLELQRLKRRKLQLKDHIMEIEAQVYPDIIA